MAFCPNCGTEYEALPLRCQCGYIFGGASPSQAPNVPLAAPLPQTQTAPVQEARFSFTGQGQDLLVLYIKLIVFSIFTLGIYSFWGRTEIRRYLWSRIHLAGQPFAYHGTGKELLMGWLKLIGLVLLFVAATSILPLMFPRESPTVVAIGSGLLTVAGFALLPWILHGTIRYRLSRTSWQGRRFAYRGDPMELTQRCLLGALLTLVTLGIYLPYFLTDLRKYVVDNSWYGGHALQFQGQGKDLLWPWIQFLLLFIPTLTLNRFWFEARMANYNWGKTSFGGAPLQANYSGGGFFFLAFTNGLLLMFTLGIAWPWTVCRQMAYVYDNLRFEFLPRIQLTEQGIDATGALGETMGADIDLGAGLGL